MNAVNKVISWERTPISISLVSIAGVIYALFQIFSIEAKKQEAINNLLYRVDVIEQTKGVDSTNINSVNGRLWVLEESVRNNKEYSEKRFDSLDKKLDLLIQLVNEKKN